MALVPRGWRRQCDSAAVKYRKGETRTVAYGLKDADPDSIARAATAMQRTIPPRSTLVPIPNSHGSTAANRALAEELARRTGSTVADVLGRSGPVASSLVRRQSGGCGLTPQEHRITARMKPRGRVILIDNVLTTGSTAEAARKALGGRGCIRAYAEAVENQRCKAKK